jgi:hypothetical protein
MTGHANRFDHKGFRVCVLRNISELRIWYRQSRAHGGYRAAQPSAPTVPVGTCRHLHMPVGTCRYRRRYPHCRHETDVGSPPVCPVSDVGFISALWSVARSVAFSQTVGIMKYTDQAPLGPKSAHCVTPSLPQVGTHTLYHIRGTLGSHADKHGYVWKVLRSTGINGMTPYLLHTDSIVSK